MLVANFVISGIVFKLAVNFEAVYVRGEKQALFFDVYCCQNTWRPLMDVEQGSNVIEFNYNGDCYYLMFDYDYKHGLNKQPVETLIVSKSKTGNGRIYNFVQSAR